MPEQQGHILTKGTLNNLTYTRRKVGGYRVMEKGKFDGARLLNDPAFELTRHNMSEFTKAASAGKFLRSALQGSLNFSADSSAVRRLFSAMSKVIKSDPVNQRGQRSVMKGDPFHLKKFEFNEKSPLESTLTTEVTSTIDRVAGQVILDIPALIPANQIFWPEGATHCKINSVAIALDFETGEFETAKAFTADIPFGREPIAAIHLVSQLEANNTKMLLHIVGIEFAMVTNGFTYQVKNQGFTAMKIVEVDTPA